MSKITCAIIKDLIPLYVDDICSQDTKNCVEEHTAECAECKKILEICKNAAFSGESVEKKQFDAMKKVKNKLRRQRIVIGAFLLILIWFGIGSAMGSMPWRNNGILRLDYRFLFPAALVIYGLFTAGQKNLQKPQKRDWCFTVVSAAITVFYIAFYSHALFSSTKEGSYLGLPAHRVGPLLDMIFILLFFVQFALFLYGLRRLFGQSRNTILCGVVHLTGMFLLLEYIEYAYHMENYTAMVTAFHAANIFFPAVGLTACLILLCIRRFCSHHEIK